MSRISFQSHISKSPLGERCANNKLVLESLESRLVLDSTVVFNEIMFQPAGVDQVEWIELHNQMAVDMDLSGWRIDGGVKFDFPEGAIIPGQGFAVVASDPTKLTLTDPALLLGPFSGRLNNGGEELRLLNNIDSFVTRPNNDAVLPESYWSFDIQGQGGVIANPNPPTMSGADQSTGLGNIWNQINVSGHRGVSENPVFSNLVNQTGNLTPVEFSIQGTVSGWANRDGDALIDDYLFVNAGNANRTASWTITGLTPGATYEIFAFGGVARDALLTVDSNGDDRLEVDDSSQFITSAGSLFESITASASGSILGSISPGNAGEANWSGFHLIEGKLRDDDREAPTTVLSGNQGRRIMDRIEYRPNYEWPIPPFGSGATLAKKSPNLGSSSFVNWVSSGIVGGTPGTSNELRGAESLPTIAINEITSFRDDWRVELFNFGVETIDLNGMLLAAAGSEQQFILNGILDAGQFLALDKSAIGIEIDDGQELFLFQNPSRTRVLDAVRIGSTDQARFPDGTGRWLVPSTLTLGTQNMIHLHDEIVINEIHYHGYPDRGTPDIPPQFEETVLLPIDATWRYNRNVTNEGLPTGWAMTTHPFDGDTWLQGPGLLGATNRPDSLPAELETDFGDIRQSEPRVLTFYFETDFEFTGDPDAVDLQLDTVIDDGAVFYLNGQEVLRQNMPSGDIDAQTRATPAVPQPNFSGPTSIATENLLVGTNRLSVEVHQSSPTSSDMIFGTTVGFRTQVSDVIPGDPFRENEEEWIELHNRGDETIDLSSWKLDGGLSFEFPEASSLAAGEYLLVVSDRDSFIASRPELSELVAGEFDGSLNNKSDTIRLLDELGNPSDEVTYYDDGRWPSAADAGGSSLELRNPNTDNSVPESWAASDESGRSVWQTYRYRGVAIDDGLGNDIFHELVLGLLDAGEVLLDDVRVVEDPDGSAVWFLQNSDFEGDSIGEVPDSWRLIGTHGDHRRSFVVVDPDDPNNKVLRLVASGPTENKHNQASTTYGDRERLEVGKEYEISFRAKWISGSNQVNTRLYFNFLQATTLIDVPSFSGTPGRANTAFVQNVGPTYHGLRHQPVIPDPDEPVTVSIFAEDPDSIASVDLFYSVDGAAFEQVAMMHQGEGQYAGVIPPQEARDIVQFYVQGTDSLGGVSLFPEKGPESRALYVVQDGQARLGDVHNLRFVMTSDDTSFMYRNINRMSNDRLGATVIYDESEVFYDVGVRLKGSAFGRNNDQVAGLSIRFHPDQLFRGVHETLSIERAGNRKELIAKHMLNRAAGGLSTFYDDVAHVIAPRRRDTGVALFAMARTSDVYLESLHENGGSTPLYNLELLYSPTSTVGGDPEAPKLNFPYTHDNGRPQFEDLGGDKETYRWNFQLRNARGRDDYRPLIATAQAFSRNGQQLEDAVKELIDVDQWMRTFAMLSLNGNDDVYTRLWEHNFRSYVRPEDGKMLAVPWDLDRAFQLSVSASPWGITNNAGVRNNVANIIERPVYERLFWGHILDIANTTANAEYMERWTDHYGRLARQSFRAELGYITSRANFLLRRLPEEVPFEITTNAGNDLTVADRTVTLDGRGWVNVRQIRVHDGDKPLDVTWRDGESWSVNVHLVHGDNQLRLEALDHQGQVVGVDSIRVESTASNPVVEGLRITELNFNPHSPTQAEINIDPTLDNDDFEFIEVQNVGDVAINLQDVHFVSGIEYRFSSVELQPGEIELIVRDSEAFPIRYPGVRFLGEYESGRLNNGGERVQLATGNGVVFIDIDYQDEDPWYALADGGGATLELIEPAATPLEEVGLPGRWRASTELGGTPGSVGVPNADFNQDGTVDDQDLDLLAIGIQTGDLTYDITADGSVDQEDVVFVVEHVLGTSIGDANLDGVFNSSDFVLVFRAGEYEDTEAFNSGWREGDWNGDREFSSGDLVFAFRRGGFVAAVVASEKTVRRDNLADLAAVLATDTHSTSKRSFEFSMKRDLAKSYSGTKSQRDDVFADPQNVESFFSADPWNQPAISRQSGKGQDWTMSTM